MLVSFRLEIVLILTQDRCTICAERTTSLEIILDAPDGMQDRCTVCAKRTIGLESFWTPAMVLLGDKAQVEARFSLFGGRLILMHS
jgi:hypothetical protein